MNEWMNEWMWKIFTGAPDGNNAIQHVRGQALGPLAYSIYESRGMTQYHILPY